jgi:hypothetical protein
MSSRVLAIQPDSPGSDRSGNPLSTKQNNNEVNHLEVNDLDKKNYGSSNNSPRLHACDIPTTQTALIKSNQDLRTIANLTIVTCFVKQLK